MECHKKGSAKIEIKTVRSAFIIATLILSIVVTLPFFSASANASVIVPTGGIHLGYNNGTYVVLPAGTYNSVYRIANQWYVNGVAYPSSGTPVTVTISSPTNTTYSSSTVTVTFSASGGTISHEWFNFKNASSWGFASNQTYSGSTTSTGFVNGTYVFVAWANNTSSDLGRAQVTFTVSAGVGGTGALTVTISPSSATIYLGQSVTFNSTISGGTAPYYYQWYLNGVAVNGATASTWMFTPVSVGSFTVYLIVIDGPGLHQGRDLFG